MKADKEFIREILFKAIIANYDNKNCNIEDIKFDTDFSSGYNIPSVSLVAFIAELEEEYSIELKVSDMVSLHTINDIADYIEKADDIEYSDTNINAPELSLDDLFAE